MVNVPVRIDENGIVQDRSVRIKKRDDDEVRWIATNGGGPWTIVFDKNGTPFGSSTFYVERGSQAQSGPAAVPSGSTAYEYSVYAGQDTSGKPVDDPDVIVDP